MKKSYRSYSTYAPVPVLALSKLSTTDTHAIMSLYQSIYTTNHPLVQVAIYNHMHKCCAPVLLYRTTHCHRMHTTPNGTMYHAPCTTPPPPPPPPLPHSASCNIACRICTSASRKSPSCSASCRGVTTMSATSVFELVVGM